MTSYLTPLTHLFVIEEFPVEVVFELLNPKLLVQYAIERDVPPVKVRAQRRDL